jgi:hypothetical protein
MRPIRISCDKPSGAATGPHLLAGRHAAIQSAMIVNRPPVGRKDRGAQAHVNQLSSERTHMVITRIDDQPRRHTAPNRLDPVELRDTFAESAREVQARCPRDPVMLVRLENAS